MLKSLLISGFSFLTILTCSQKKPEVQAVENTATNSSTAVTKDSSSNIEVGENNNQKITETENNISKEVTQQPSKTSPKKPVETRTTAPVNSQTSRPAKGRLAQPQMIYFKEKENKFLKDFEMNVTFNKITEDSRCPKGVNCVWEGVAVAELTVMGTYTRPMTINLSTLNNSAKGYQNSTVFNGYKITLESVTPYPTSSSKKADGKYQIGITIRPAIDKDSMKNIKLPVNGFQIFRN